MGTNRKPGRPTADAAPVDPEPVAAEPTAPPPREGLVSAADAAKFLGNVSPRHVRNLGERGVLPVVRVGRRVMFPWRAVLRLAGECNLTT